MKLKRIRNRGYESIFPRCEPQGESALLVRLGEKIDLDINLSVHSLAHELESHSIQGFQESIPGYCTLLIAYDPLVLEYEKVEEWVQYHLDRLPKNQTLPHKQIDIPVIYGGERGCDLEEVARLHNLSPAEVIHRHSSVLYTVYFIGFLPGFPYLGGMDSSIETPRLTIPRTIVKAGSVGIAGTQTGIYPLDSPGGWRIIGWTPEVLFDPMTTPPAKLSPGDTVRFIHAGDLK